jgi:hypothetical protein
MVKSLISGSFLALATFFSFCSFSIIFLLIGKIRTIWIYIIPTNPIMGGFSWPNIEKCGVNTKLSPWLYPSRADYMAHCEKVFKRKTGPFSQSGPLSCIICGCNPFYTAFGEIDLLVTTFTDMLFFEFV